MRGGHGVRETVQGWGMGITEEEAGSHQGGRREGNEPVISCPRASVGDRPPIRKQARPGSGPAGAPMQIPECLGCSSALLTWPRGRWPAPPGLFSTIMWDLANITHDGPKWIVLDGDIDPMWIESLNTVMDDNKVCELLGSTVTP